MMKHLFTAALAAVLLGSCLCGCSGKGDEDVTASEESSAASSATQEATTEDPLTLNPDLKAIATKYGELLYPERWAGAIRTNVVENSLTTVEIFATIGKHKENKLYDVVFGGDEGVCIGSVSVGEEVIYVNLISYTWETDDSWSEDELLQLQAMKEDINYLIDGLKQL